MGFVFWLGFLFDSHLTGHEADSPQISRHLKDSGVTRGQV
jgi:hypothetical protein